MRYFGVVAARAHWLLSGPALCKSILATTAKQLISWRVKLTDIHALAHAVNCFPENTPRRWQLVSQLISYCSDDGGTIVEVGLPSNGGDSSGTMIV